MGDTLDVLRSLPDEVRDAFGFALFEAQNSRRHPATKPMKGNLSGVMEIVEDLDGDTYRAMYTLKIAGRVVVLHVFQKKATRGIATPQRHLDLIAQRLRQAKETFRD